MDVTEQAVDLREQAEGQSATENIAPDRADVVAVAAPVVAEDGSALPQSAAPQSPPAAPVSPISWLRLTYILEFWLVLIGIFVVWSEVGGQGHLDLIAWYLKLSCGIALAWAMVKMTGAAVENTRAWNRRTKKWFLAIVALSALIAGITYWYHLHEVPDEPDTDENSATTVRNGALQQNVYQVVMPRGRQHC